MEKSDLWKKENEGVTNILFHMMCAILEKGVCFIDLERAIYEVLGLKQDDTENAFDAPKIDTSKANISRSDIENNPLYDLEPFTKMGAFIDLILLSVEDGKHDMEFDENITYKTGEILYPKEALACKWKWTLEKVNSFYKGLEELGLVRRRWYANSYTIVIKDEYNYKLTRK